LLNCFTIGFSANNILLTLVGTSFGPIGTVVLVETQLPNNSFQACTNALVSVAHSTITCQLGAGLQLSRQVRLTLGNQVSNSLFISYSGMFCLATHFNELLCTNM